MKPLERPLIVTVHDADGSQVYVSVPVGSIEVDEVSAADGSSVRSERPLGFGSSAIELVISGAVTSVAFTVRSVVYQVIHRNDGKRVVILRRRGKPDIDVTGCSLKEIDRYLDT